MKRTDLFAGATFGILTILEEIPMRNGIRHFRCRCKCGSDKEYRIGSVVSCLKLCICNGVPKRSINPGDRFGIRTIVGEVEKIKGVRAFLCRCDCGAERIHNLTAVKQCPTKCACGFKKIEMHGLHNHLLYGVWKGMKERCNRPSHHAYRLYGARGIKVHQEWLDSFMSFYDWSMSNGYKKGLSIDRRDNDGGYFPENCRWVNSIVQGNNRSKTVFVEFRGEKRTLRDWSELIGIPATTLGQRSKSKSFNRPFDSPIKPTQSRARS